MVDGQTVGLYHEQNRSDRDKWVEINTRNIKSGHEGNFEIEKSVAVGDFDFGSIMLYSS